MPTRPPACSFFDYAPGFTGIRLPTGQVARIDTDQLQVVAPFAWNACRSSTGSYYVHAPIHVAGRTKTLCLHRVLMGCVFGDGLEVDHRNGDTLDNTIANLRVTTHSNNMRNRHRTRNLKDGGFKGVSWVRADRRWYASIRAGERGTAGRAKTIALGRYREQIVAARAYDSAAAHYFGEFAALNFPGQAPLPFDPIARRPVTS